MSFDSIASAAGVPTGSHKPTAVLGVVEHEPEDTTSPPFGFETPNRFVARHAFSKSLESPPRKKHRCNVSSSVYLQCIAPRSSTGPNVSHLAFLRDDASILARLDLSNVPSNEFILARPNQVSNICDLDYMTYKARPRTVSVSTNDADADADPLADSEDIFGFLQDEQRDSPSPHSLGHTPTSVFLPINVQHLESSLSELHMMGTNGSGFSLKPRPGKRTAHHGTRPWDLEFTF